MAKKKVVRKASRKSVSRRKEVNFGEDSHSVVSKKFRFVLARLIFFAVLLIISFLFYVFSSSELYVAVFGLLSVIFGVIALTFLFIFLVMLFMQFFRNKK